MSVVLLLSVIPIFAAENSSTKEASKEISYTLIDTKTDEYIDICKNESYILKLNPSNQVFVVCDRLN
ncbi:MAG: hypothetical protein J6L58_04525 [Clostridia bacterium]|nr:hypothetical protein [Clostridia bacterium]